MSGPQTFSCQFTVEEPGGVVVAALVGELDHEAAEPFGNQVDELHRAGHRRFVFDLGRLTYIGSMGLRVFALLASRVKADGAVCLCDDGREHLRRGRHGRSRGAQRRRR